MFSGLKVIGDGFAKNLVSDCPGVCKFKWDPVCGTDGKTYPNIGCLEVAACKPGNKDLAVAYKGKCKGILVIEYFIHLSVKDSSVLLYT